ncbi:MAG: hypothetical protein HC848_08890 [Limnobacter sp.]|nr:hypothetical protein [Limnobacter sp.]
MAEAAVPLLQWLPKPIHLKSPEWRFGAEQEQAFLERMPAVSHVAVYDGFMLRQGDTDRRFKSTTPDTFLNLSRLTILLSLRSLDLSAVIKFTQGDVENLATLTALTRLCVERPYLQVQQFGNPSVNLLPLTALVNLKSLSLNDRHIYPTNFAQLASCLTGLTSLSAKNIVETNAAMQAVARMETLQQLDLSLSPGGFGRTIDSVEHRYRLDTSPLSALVGLQSLSVANRGVTQAASTALAGSLGQLTHLNATNSISNNHAALCKLAEMEALQHLELATYTFRTADLEKLASLSGLKKLTIGNSVLSNTNQPSNPAYRMDGLRSLVFAYPPRPAQFQPIPTCEGFADWFNRCSNLECLGLYRLPEITQEILKSVSSMGELQELIVESSLVNKGAQFPEPLTGLKKLHTLSLAKSYFEPLFLKSVAGISTLRTLNLSGCRSGGERLHNLEPLKELLPKLHSLNVMGCAVDVDQLSNARELEWLEMTATLADQHVETLLAHSPGLRGLGLCEFSFISSTGKGLLRHRGVRLSHSPLYSFGQ